MTKCQHALVQKKYYSVDTGIVNLFKGISNNYSKKIENIVFLKLSKDFAHIHYGAMQNGKEIDFIVKDKFNVSHKYQITLSLTDENKTRELFSFYSSDHYLNKMNNILLSMDEYDETIQVDECIINKKYLLKWLLDL